MRLALPTLLLVVLAVALAGCGTSESAGSADGKLRVVATTTHLGDFAREVGDDRVSVHTMLGSGTDPPDYEPRPSDARAVAEADVVLQSGGDLDAWLGDVIEAAGGDAPRLTLLDEVRAIEGGHGAEAHAGEDEQADEEHAGEAERDPHWWQDPRNAAVAIERIGATFADADAAGASDYRSAARRYAGEIERADTAIARCMDGIDVDRRKLVTNHDAFGYFARRYDIEVLGSIVPALSSSAQPSAGDVRRLVAAIKRERVTTIFPESALNVRLERAVARDAGVEVGPALYADTLGPKGSVGATYRGALRHDAAAIAKGFGGDCDLG
jgi:zinc/manganese transport system substrate-binding protein